MLRGWDRSDAEFEPQQHQYDHGENVEDTIANAAICRGEDSYLQQESSNVEIITEDPLASPGNSSINSGHFGGWSIGPGMVDKESVDINPFDDDDDDDEDENEDDDDDDQEYERSKAAKNNRSSSPRESHFTAHGLSMIKEEGRRSDATNLDSPGSNNFDDVDLEAYPQNSTTRDSTSRQNSSSNGNNFIFKGNIANRVIQEFKTNPKFKFQVLVAFSMLLVASCLIAIIVAAPDGSKQSVSVEQDKAAHLSELLDGLQSSTHKPTSRPTKAPQIPFIVKKTTKPTVAVTEYPTLLPTMYPTFSTLIPSADTSVKLKTLNPSSLASTLALSKSTFKPTKPDSSLNSTVLLITSKPSPAPQVPTIQPSSYQITHTPTRDCTDSSGEFMTYNDKPRTCEWLDNGFNGAKSDRKDLNCKNSDLGDACKYTCRLYNGCMEYFLQSTEDFSSENDFSIGDRCADKEGSFISNGDIPRTCKWLDEDPNTAAAKKELNCGTSDNARTELGTMCPQSCIGYNECKSASDGSEKNRSEDEVGDDITRFKVDKVKDGGTGDTDKTTDIPTFFPTAGDLNKAANASIITLATVADSTVSQKDDDANFGDSKRLNVEHDADGNTSKERQALLKFDLSSAAESFGGNGGKATLHIFSVVGSKSGGIILKKMASSDWTEDDVKWKNVPGGDGSDEMIISSLDRLESNTWYDIDATAAVRNALKNKETYLGIRLVSDDSVDLYFGSKEREKEQPVLVIDPNAAQPPSEEPTSSPTVILDCMDQKTDFQSHTGEFEECSWLNEGDDTRRKELNCQDEGEATYICQASCSMYNGCDDLQCIDLSGNYATHNGWTAPCSWLQTDEGMLALDQNCGGSLGYETTELGKRCQASCSAYNGCSEATTKQLDEVPVETAPVVDSSSRPTAMTTTFDTVEDIAVPIDTSPGDTSNSPTYSTTSSDTTSDTVADVAVPTEASPVDTSNSPTYSTTSSDTTSDTVADVAVPTEASPVDTSNSPTYSTTSSDTTSSTTSLDTALSDDLVSDLLTSIPTFTPTVGEPEDVVINGDDSTATENLNIPTFMPTTVNLDESANQDETSQDTPTYFPSTEGLTR